MCFGGQHDVGAGPCRTAPCRRSGTVPASSERGTAVKTRLCWRQGSDTDPAERKTARLDRTAARSSPAENKHLHWNLKLISEHEDSGLQASGASPLKIQTPQTDTASHYLYYHMLINYNCVETCWSHVWSRTVPRPLSVSGACLNIYCDKNVKCEARRV